ncbi:DNA polymerase epsilon catalytic subunit A [Nadsonia fulvescens var. elongata DSM 6958]|uniref:DNA polymerase epsilon catalytic subunit n=1 Tax=Nadsonia fulvescens var. elongata DSM 6958 TaxID=857566 RepID=A0A1E3PE40_9ASCO|nr:DNA polymerase epsilon catalytic subunit A [Nadsonia fulvescens var. elongata DSM 6958]
MGEFGSGQSKYKRSGNNTRFVKNRQSGATPAANDLSNLNLKDLSLDATSVSQKFEAVEIVDKLDSQMGFERYEAGPNKVGWLINMHSTIIKSEEAFGGYSGVDYYFLDDEGGSFKSTVKFDPYFLLCCKPGSEADVEEFLRRKFEGILKKIAVYDKEDLQLPNHLLGNLRRVLMLSFNNQDDMFTARKVLMPIIQMNQKSQDTVDIYAQVSESVNDMEIDFNGVSKPKHIKQADAVDLIYDIKEFDVPYHVRVAIDREIRVGKWYSVEAKNGTVKLSELTDRIARADPVVLAFDIETSKLPLKFPDAATDAIMMISYMIDGEGFLITNRSIVSKDIDDFEYTPKPEYPGLFTVFNEPTEQALLQRFFEHIQEIKPHVIVTFNGDFFDWPYVETRASIHEINMYHEIGFMKDNEGEFKSTYCAHMDAFRWVKRDSYLPQGSQGLKAVTTAKLGYNPIELDPEKMTPYAYEYPQILAEYSVSDAVATYYLYMKYVHPFIFSLCNIIPLNPDEVLRKGTGTLCEMLLMVEAYKGDILMPHKHKEPDERFYNGHLLESETYVGGHVESLEAGVFRSDIPETFNIDPTAVEELLRDLDAALVFSIEVEGGKKLADITNYEEVKQGITEALKKLLDQPKRHEIPSIYHVDVASMYPNIMTTNRLQPDSMITEEDCAACDFNRPGKNCDRRLPWAWRGDYFPAKSDEYLMIKRSLYGETFPGRYPRSPVRTFEELSPTEQAAQIKKRITEYSRKVYHRVHLTQTVEREAIICQRENPFYIDTVRDFRDRRYDYKNQAKLWKGKLSEVDKSDISGKEEAKKMIILYDSLQLAHKVILNSFYGYVMRKGSRWYSMEMAGVTCLTGATIIQMARKLVERIGRPLELDTDGIWCILPKTFPEEFIFKLNNGKKLFISYPCVMLNHLVHARFTNHQYQTLDPKTFKYETHSDNSIFFEVDGPYKAMVLPTSKEEDKNLKKRYAVFNDDGSLAELKGFEVKRRGELKLIKIFQTQIFKVFLDGTNLEECYGAVANVANRWLDILESKGKKMEDEDLVDLICENRSMSKSLEEYGSQKSTSITTAKRLAEFLGESMVKDKGLACKYIISAAPASAPVTERAIPVAIFSTDLAVKKQYLRRWLKDNSLEDFDIRNILDWKYYWDRFASVIQKLITIPAALQLVENPVPRIPHPDWLRKRLAKKKDVKKQQDVQSFFKKVDKDMVQAKMAYDIEDIGKAQLAGKHLIGRKAKVTSVKRKAQANFSNGMDDSEEQLLASLPELMPSPDDDYPAWIKYQKIKWKIQYQARERRRHLFGANAENMGNGTVSSLLRNKTQQVFSNSWQVLQVRSTETPGEIKVSVLINDRIQNVKVVVPKKIIVNFKSDNLPDGVIPGCHVEKINSLMPNGHSSAHLFRLTMPELTYLEEMEKPDTILKHSSVAGLFESQISATTRMVLNVGVECKLDDSKPGLLGHGLEHGFNIDTLVSTNSSGSDFLSRGALSYLYLFHIAASDFQVFSLIPTWSEKAYVFVLRPSLRSQSLPNLTKLYAEQFAAKAETLNKTKHIFEYVENVQFEETYFDDINKLYKKLNSACEKLQSEKGTHTILVLQSPTTEKLKKTIRSINEFPILGLRATDLKVPSLGWQAVTARRIISHNFGLGAWIIYLSQLSRYSNVPLCNLNYDNATYLIDISYARKLQSSNIILWWSPNPIPDHGGAEKDNVLLNSEIVDIPIINNPGLYNSVSLEISVNNLAVNTILTSALINEAEGTDLADIQIEGAEGNNMVSFLENSFSGSALNVLRSMLKEWWDQALHEDTNADVMVHNFVRWVSQSDSFLFDSSLYYHVQNLAKKAFLQLIAEFRRFGAKVIYANQNKLIVNTTKFAIGNAFAYSQYILKAIRSRSLFNYLDLTIEKYWDIILFMDDVNFGGQACSEIVEQEQQNLVTTTHWHMKSFLPMILQQELEDWIIEFLEEISNAKSSTDEFASAPRTTQIPKMFRKDTTSMLKDVNAASTKHDEDEEVYFGKGIITNLSAVLKKRVQQLIRRQTDALNNADAQIEFEFPKLPGSYLDLHNPVLQFVKSICAVLALSKDMNFEVRKLRRDLLEMFDVPEFSEEAVFKNPSASLRLTNVICNNCCYRRDIDFCRDSSLITSAAPGTGEGWKCSQCHREYDRIVLEERLIEMVEKLMYIYISQDLKCSRCMRIREDEMSEHCACSGEWVETVSTESSMKSLNVFFSVAKYFDMKLLENMIEAM